MKSFTSILLLVLAAFLFEHLSIKVHFIFVDIKEEVAFPL